MCIEKRKYERKENTSQDTGCGLRYDVTQERYSCSSRQHFTEYEEHPDKSSQLQFF